jgi:predicted lipoprotein with Yx(FWY)xxD motif
LLVLVAFAAAAVGGVAGAGTRSATVFSIRNTSLGAILVGAGDRTLYHDAAEKRDRIACTGSCAQRWPPLVVVAGAKPLAGRGITASLLGTVRRPDGRIQVTYRGLPLYFFSGDMKAGEVNGQGDGGTWHALAPSGMPVTKSVAAAGAATSSSESSSTMPGSETSSAPSPSVNPGMWCAANPQSCVNGVPVSH